MERHHKFANVITATVMQRIWMKLARKASRLDVSNGSILSKKGAVSAATLGRSFEPAGTGADWGWASPDAGVGLDADATNATCTTLTQLTHRRAAGVVGG